MTSKRPRIALLTGISGQDGIYLAEHLVAHGTKVVGTTRDYAACARLAGDRLPDTVEIVEWDLLDRDRFAQILDQHRPTHIYNLAAMSSGEHMDRNPELVAETNGFAVLGMLETIRHAGAGIRFCQASSSEVFAGAGVSPQNESTPRVPRSIYGAAKIFADNIVKLYREKFGLFCGSAILFNHESPRRGDGFVTKKIVRAAVRIKLGRQGKLSLGNLETARDWGFAGDYMSAMALMAEAPEPADYVIATGVARTVSTFCEVAFGALALDYREFVEIDPTFYRPSETAPILGDPSRIRNHLGWYKPLLG